MFWSLMIDAPNFRSFEADFFSGKSIFSILKRCLFDLWQNKFLNF